MKTFLFCVATVAAACFTGATPAIATPSVPQNQAAFPSAEQTPASTTQVRRTVNCKMGGGGRIQMTLTRMGCKPAANLMYAWWKRYMPKPKRILKIRGFTCRWTGPLIVNADGRLNCRKGTRGFNVKLP